MKKILLILLCFPSLIIAQELSPSLGITLVNFTFENEFDIPFSNTEIKLVQFDNRHYSMITDSLGKSSILLNQGNSFRIICVINGSDYEFDNQLDIHKQESLFTLDMELKLELYSEIIELSDVYFLSGKYTIQEKSELELNKIVSYLLSDDTINIEIAGHTDDVGTKNDNKDLSKNRALSVKTFLVNKGISENRIVCVGYGEIQPIAQNNNAEDRAKNRRIEMRILKK